MLSGRFASSSASQYHELLPSLKDLVTYIQQKICANDASCKASAEALRSVDYLDVDYDTISQSFTMSAFWHTSPNSRTWNEKVDNRGGSMKVEVGVLSKEKATHPEELSLGGFLAVIGEDSKPSTLQRFPSFAGLG